MATLPDLQRAVNRAEKSFRDLEGLELPDDVRAAVEKLGRRLHRVHHVGEEYTGVVTTFSGGTDKPPPADDQDED